jgi:hypothetical protein
LPFRKAHSKECRRSQARQTGSWPPRRTGWAESAARFPRGVGFRGQRVRARRSRARCCAPSRATSPRFSSTQPNAYDRSLPKRSLLFMLSTHTARAV